MAGKLILAGRKGLYWFADGNDTTNYSNGTLIVSAADGSINTTVETVVDLTTTGNTILGNSVADTLTITSKALTLNSTTQELKMPQVGADATGYADQRSSGILNFESSQWNGSAAVAGNFSIQSIPSGSANVTNLTLKYGSTTLLAVDSRSFFVFTSQNNTFQSASSTTTDLSSAASVSVKTTNTTVNNITGFLNKNGGSMITGGLVYKNTSHHASTGSANFELWLANGATADKVTDITAAGSHVIGRQAALATTATDGFLYVPSCAGTPTGVPTSFTGKIAVCADSTNNKLYIYSGGGWVALN